MTTVNRKSRVVLRPEETEELRRIWQAEVESRNGPLHRRYHLIALELSQRFHVAPTTVYRYTEGLRKVRHERPAHPGESFRVAYTRAVTTYENEERTVTAHTIDQAIQLVRALGGVHKITAVISQEKK